MNPFLELCFRGAFSDADRQTLTDTDRHFLKMCLADRQTELVCPSSSLEVPLVLNSCCLWISSISNETLSL